MKTYLRILSYGSPWSKYIFQYLLFTLLYVVFSVFNVALLIPLLDVLFNQVDPEVVNQLSNPYGSTTIMKEPGGQEKKMEKLLRAKLYTCLTYIAMIMCKDLKKKCY